MKIQLLTTFAFLFIVYNAFAQWSTNGTTVRLATTSNNVGIGLTTASEKLHVSGNILGTGTITGTTFIGTGIFQSSSSNNLSFRTNTTTRLTVLNSNGNIGIDETTPLEKLHINGSIRGDQSGAVRISSGNGTVDIGAKTGSYGNIDTDRSAFLFNKKVIVDGGALSSFDEPLALQAAGVTGLTILTSGNVGIGTTLPSNPNNYRLAVNGRIGAKEVQVETNSSAWPDYVFKPGYELTPLNELESYIRQNNHLPDVPSASQIEAEGHKLGEMDAVLLLKIEELTLYMIELKKQNDELKKELVELKSAISQK